MEIKIYYEDTDCGGVVYYANYLKYFERARTDFLEQRGITVSGLLRAGTQFMVAHAEVHYRSPARFGETMWIETEIADAGKVSLTFAHRILEATSKRLIVEGSARLAATTLEGKLKRLDPLLLDALKKPPTVARLKGSRRPAGPSRKIVKVNGMHNRKRARHA